MHSLGVVLLNVPFTSQFSDCSPYFGYFLLLSLFSPIIFSVYGTVQQVKLTLLAFENTMNISLSYRINPS